MLKNDPPPGTAIRTTTTVRKHGRGTKGRLVKPLRRYPVDRPDDEFEIEIDGERLIVRREDIEEIASPMEA